jgi:protein-tyrosine phosphatase
MAAGLAGKMLEGTGKAESAGIAPFGYRAAGPTIRVMEEEGIDLSAHRPRDVAELSPDEFDYVVAMDSTVHGFLKMYGRVTEQQLISWDIPDPYGQDADAYADCFERIRSHLKDLFSALGLSGETGPGT